MTHNIYLYIFVAAAVSCLIRTLPLTLIRGKIENPFIRSFLYYVPYTCLTAMTFPAILYATESIWSALAGVAVAAALAFYNKSLLTVAAFACAAVFLTEQLLPVL